VRGTASPSFSVPAAGKGAGVVTMAEVLTARRWVGKLLHCHLQPLIDITGCKAKQPFGTVVQNTKCLITIVNRVYQAMLPLPSTHCATDNRLRDRSAVFNAFPLCPILRGSAHF
jgi:hypothetical protein